MVKRSRGKQRGGVVQRGARRHRIRAAASDLNSTAGGDRASQRLALISRFGRGCWILQIKLCSSLCLVPYKMLPSGKLTMASVPRRIIYVTIAVIHTLISIFRAWVTLNQIIDEGLNTTTYLCALVTGGMLSTQLCTLGTLWKDRMMLDLINSWTLTLGCFDYHPGSDCMAYFADTPLSIKLAASIGGMMASVVDVSFLSLLPQLLPVCIYPTVKRVGILPENSLPDLFWQLVFLPLEYLIMLAPVATGAFNVGAGIIGLNVLRMCAEKLRAVSVTDTESWYRVERLYRCISLANNLLSGWFQYCAAPTIFGVCSIDVLFLYITLRPSGLTTAIYIWIPLLAANVIVVVTWFCYDCVNVRRTGEDITEKLQRRTSPYFLRLSLSERKWYVRKGLALRPPKLVMGEFGDITLGMVCNIWDEVLNQLIFLLTL